MYSYPSALLRLKNIAKWFKGSRRLVLLLFILPFYGNTCPAYLDPTAPFDVLNLDQDSASQRNLYTDELEVVQSSPQGLLNVSDLNREIVVVFNQPMVPLAKLKDVTSGVMQITPEIKGKFRWYGSRVNAFIPLEKMKPGTEYLVKIAAGTKSMGKKSLTKDHSFSFKSPPLKYSYSSPYINSTIPYDQAIRVNFNYAIKPAEAQKFISLTENGTPVAFKASIPPKNSDEDGDDEDEEESVDENSSKTLIIKAARKFGRDARIKLVLGKGLPPSGGNAGLEDDVSILFKTFGPLTATLTNRADFYQDSYGIYLYFNNPVQLDKMIEKVKTKPELKVVQPPDGSSNYFYMSAYSLKPQTDYEIELPAGLECIYGNKFTGERKFKFSVPRIRKSFSMTSGFNTVESRKRQFLPAFAAGVSTVKGEIHSFGIAELQKFVSVKTDHPYEILRKSASSTTAFQTGINPKTMGSVALKMDPFLKNKKGWVLADIKAEVENWKGIATTTNPHAVLQSTDLGLIIKQAPGYSHAYVHSLTPGEAVKNAHVTAYDGQKSLGSCKTNDIGYCQVIHTDHKRPAHPLYVASYEDDKAFVSGRYHSVYMGSEDVDFDLLSYESSLSGVIEFDRKLYKPGETMFFKSFLALIKSEVLSTDIKEKAQVSIYDSRGKQLAVSMQTISKEGGIDGQFPIPANSPTGHYRIQVKLPGQNSQFEKNKKLISSRDYGYNNIQGYNRFIISDTFQVEEFRPVQFSVAIDTKTASLQKDKVHPFKVKGMYLFGAPMVKAPVHYTIQKRKSHAGPENYSAYRFGDFDYRNQDYGWMFLASGNGTLNGAGEFSAEISFQKSGTPASEMGLDVDRKLATLEDYTIESKVIDVDKKSVTHTKTIRMDPAPQIIGISPKDTYNSQNVPFEFKLVAVQSNGNASGNMKTRVAVVFNDWKSIQTKGPAGTVQRKNTLVRKTVHSTALTLNHKPSVFKYQPQKPGWYSLIVYGQDDDVYSRISFYVYGDGFIGWNFSDDDSIELLADKATYKPGDKAKILIQSPFKSARAIVSLERNGIMWQKSFILSGNSFPVEIPITKTHAPVVYASVMMIRPRVELSDKDKDDHDDMGRPKFKMGYIALNVLPEQNKLPLKIQTNKKSYGPGDMVSIQLSTAPNAEVALSTADRGVLDLIAYSYKNPDKSFRKKLPLGVLIMENRQSLIRQLSYARKGDDPGGKGEESDSEGKGGFDKNNEDGIRKDFRYTAHWSPNLIADQNGKINLNFKLPDNLTTFRIMAIAAKSGQYNAANQEIQVRQPVVLQPVYPSILRPGDELKTGAVIINQTGQDIDISLDLESDMLNIKGAKEKSVHIKNGDSKQVLFEIGLASDKYLLKKKELISSLQAAQKLPIDGIKGIQIAAIISANVKNAQSVSQSSGLALSELKDRMAFKIDVVENPPAEAFTISGFVDKNAQIEKVEIPKKSEILDNLGNLDIAISNTALTGISRGFDFFKDNPYFCLEQRASAFITGVSAKELIYSFPQKNVQPDGYQFKELEKLFLDKLPDYQNSDGGFRLWKDSKYKVSQPYLSAWVVFGMQVAKANGYKIDEGMKNKTLQYLSVFRQKPGNEDKKYLLSTYSLIAWVLARDNRADVGLNNYLLKNEQLLGLRDKSYLLLSIGLERNIKDFKQDPDTKRLMQSILDSMQFTTRAISFKEDYDSFSGRSFQARGTTLALVLRTMIDLNGTHPMIPQIIRHIIDSRNQNVWSDSHSSANLAHSLGKYYDKYENTSAARQIKVELGKTILMQFQLDPPAKKLTQINKRFTLDELYKTWDAGKQYDLSFQNTAHNPGRFYYTASLGYLPKLLKAKARDEGIEVIREVIALSDLTSNKFETKIIDTLGGEALKLGKMYLVRILVTNPKPSFNFTLIDPLPSTMEAVNSEFATESPIFSRFLDNQQTKNQPWWMREDIQYEYRKDKVISTSDYLSPGAHEFMYLARPIVSGKANVPSAQAWLMYAPEVFGRTASGNMQVDP